MANGANRPTAEVTENEEQNDKKTRTKPLVEQFKQLERRNRSSNATKRRQTAPNGTFSFNDAAGSRLVLPRSSQSVAMEKPSTSSRFRFRDHQNLENSPLSNESSEISSASCDPADETELQSMAAKGINHLCSELLELKAESDEDFHRNIFHNYAAFIRVFEEGEGMKKQLTQLKSQVSFQRRLVKDLVNVYLKALSKESIELVVQESVTAEPSTPSEMEAHISNVSETLDIILAENRIDEAITILELERENVQRLQYDGDSPSDVLARYECAISERKAMVMLQLTLVAGNPRVSAAELQKTLVQFCRLGDSHLATQLLLKYYHSRIATGIHSIESSKSFSHGVYIRELVKFVFSMISQAARSFVMLYGETSPYASEFIQWACEGIEVFGFNFNKYVKHISELSGGLSTAVKAVQCAMSFCTLLETQKLELRPFLIKQIRPCMEEVLQIHIEHFKNVITIFSATDAWVLGRYLVSGIVNEARSSMVFGQQPEYCLLTNSGRKFITLFQAITTEITPLVSLQMEGSILGGLRDLFEEYVVILERAINSQTNLTEKGGSRINSAESLPQQISILANLSTLEHCFFGSFRGIFRDINQSDSFQRGEFTSCMLFIQEVNDRLRAHFCQQLINRMMSCKAGSEHRPEACIVNVGDHNRLCDVMPSAAFQVLFLELRTVNKLAEENVFELDWLMELLREVVQTLFLWISNNKEMWALTEEDLTRQNSDVYDQKLFVLDIHFLVEIARNGRYFSDNPAILATFKNSALLSAGLDPKRHVDDEEWAKNAATKAIQKLIEIQETKSLLQDELIGTCDEEQHESQNKRASDSSQDDNRISSADEVSIDE